MATTIGSRKFDRGTPVAYEGEKWIVIKGGELDRSKHLHYRIMRGSKRATVRGDKLSRW